MLKFVPNRAAVIRCFADPGALDAFGSGLLTARVARDELWLLGGAGSRVDLANRARTQLSASDPDATIVDQSDGWSAWTVTGPGCTTVLERLSSIEVPARRPAFLQGAIAEVPGKALVGRDRLHLFAPAQFAHHITSRVLGACADLEIQVGPAEEPAFEATT